MFIVRYVAGDQLLYAKDTPRGIQGVGQEAASRFSNRIAAVVLAASLDPIHRAEVIEYDPPSPAPEPHGLGGDQASGSVDAPEATS